MAAVEKLDKLIAIVGTTASGKSAAAMQVAQQYGGEIICADSRTIYKGMDIGTAKPSKEDQAKIPHHLIDVVEPDQEFTVYDFQKLANAAIEDIQSRGKLPILVGGTGLYVDSVIYNFSFRPTDKKRRAELEKLTVNELQQEIAKQGLDLPENAQNPRHLIRVLETNGEPSKKEPLRKNTLVLGLECPPDLLKQRVTARIDQMVTEGLVEEVKALGQRYGWETAALQAPGYKAFRQYIEGSLTLDEAKNVFAKNDLQLAKRQRTWFRRNKDINWQITNEQPSVTIE